MSPTPSVRRSLGIVTITKVAAFVLSLTTAVIVSRLLSPHEIGIFSISATLIGFAAVMREFGVEQYLIQAPEITRGRRRAAFTATLAISCTIAALLLLLKPFAAQFYEEPGVEQVMGLLALNFLTLPFATPLRAQLQRELQFSKIATADLSNHFVAAAFTVGSAWMGASYKSMAIGAVAGNLAGLLALVLISPRGALDWPTRHGLREVFRFGSRSSVASFSLEIGDAAPDLILARTLGFAESAYFSRANGLLSMTFELLRSVVQSVFFPVFSRSHREGHNLSALYLHSSTKFLAVMLPALGLMALLSGPLIALMFGPQWQRSAPIGAMLCLFAMLTGPTMLAPYALVAIGHVGTLMRCRLVLAAAKVLVLLSSNWLTLELTAALLLFVSLVELLVFTRALRSTLGLSVATLWNSVRHSYALVPITVLLPSVSLWALHQGDVTSAALQIAVPGALGVASWIAGTLVTRHPIRAELSTAMKSAKAVFAAARA